MRVGSNFDHIPHGVLAGMFGRAPQPFLYHMWKLYGSGMSGSNAGIISAHPTPEHTPYCSLGFLLRNDGMSIARDVYVNLELILPGPTCAFRVWTPSNMPHPTPGTRPNPWTQTSTFDHVHHFVAADDFKLTPAGMVEPIRLGVYLQPPFDAALQYTFTYGWTGAPVNTLTHTVPSGAYGTFLSSDHSLRSGRALTRELFHLTDENLWILAHSINQSFCTTSARTRKLDGRAFVDRRRLESEVAYFLQLAIIFRLLFVTTFQTTLPQSGVLAGLFATHC
jgi:hypothetical protein